MLKKKFASVQNSKIQSELISESKEETAVFRFMDNTHNKCSKKLFPSGISLNYVTRLDENEQVSDSFLNNFFSFKKKKKNFK